MLFLAGSISVVLLVLGLRLLTTGLVVSPVAAVPLQSQIPTPTIEIAKQFPSLEPAMVATQTEDWQTYENPKFGFKIKYPPNFFRAEWPVSEPMLLSVDFIDEKWKDAGTGTQGMGVAVFPSQKELALSEWFEQRSGSFTPEGLPENVEFVDPSDLVNVKVGNYDAIKFVNHGMIDIPGVLIAKGDYIYWVWYGPGADNLEPLYELMLETLEFE